MSRAEAACAALDDAAAHLAAQIKRRDKVVAALAEIPSIAHPGAPAQEAGSERSTKRRTRSAAAARLTDPDEGSDRSASRVERQGRPAAGRTTSAMRAAATLPESPARGASCMGAGGQAPADSAPAAERPGRALRARRVLCSSDDSSPERSPRCTPCNSPPARAPQEPHTLRARTQGSARGRRGAGAVGARRLVDDSAEDSDCGVAATQGPGAASAAARRRGPRRAGRVRKTPGAGGDACGGDLEQDLLALAAEEDHLAVRKALLPVYLTCGLKQQGSWLAESTLAI